MPWGVFYMKNRFLNFFTTFMLMWSFAVGAMEVLPSAESENFYTDGPVTKSSEDVIAAFLCTEHLHDGLPTVPSRSDILADSVSMAHITSPRSAIPAVVKDPVDFCFNDIMNLRLSSTQMHLIIDTFISVMESKLSRGRNWVSGETPPAMKNKLNAVVINNTKEDFSYVAKFFAPTRDAQLIAFSDVHGRYETALDLVKRMLDYNLIDEHLVLKKNVYLVGLGDYVDRGPDALKVLALVMILAIKNVDHMLLIKGNHEEDVKNNCIDYGLDQEIYETIDLKTCQPDNFDNETGEILSLIDIAYSLMPSAVFWGWASGDDFYSESIKRHRPDSPQKQPIWLLSHAGMDIRYNPIPLLDHNVSMFKSNGGICFDVIANESESHIVSIIGLGAKTVMTPDFFLSERGSGFRWSDLYINKDIDIDLSETAISDIDVYGITNKSARTKGEASGLLVMTIPFLAKAFKKISNRAESCEIVGMVRGHQHMYPKMVAKDCDRDWNTKTVQELISVPMSGIAVAQFDQEKNEVALTDFHGCESCDVSNFCVATIISGTIINQSSELVYDSALIGISSNLDDKKTFTIEAVKS
jgi:hypothetical protein